MIRPATPASAGFDVLSSEAAEEGHRFVARLVAERRSGANRFDNPGEASRGVFRAGELVAVGGLNAGPHPPDPATARLRHVPVRPAWRRTASARRPPAACCSWRCAASGACACAPAVPARPGCAYESCGFGRMAEPDATHALALPR